MKRRITRRMSRIDSSGIRKVFDLAAALADPVNLSIGQPHFPVPQAVKQAAVEAILADRNGYTVTQGIPELRRLVEQRYRTRYRFEAEASLITSGVSGGLLLALMTLVDPDDEVLIPDPGFVMYRHLVRLLDGVPVPYTTYPDFRIDRDGLLRLITDRTKLLIVNSPSNPTGAVLDESDLRFLTETARRHDLILLSDEIYDEFCYDGPYRSLAEFADPSRLLILNGFSKSLAVTGWRVGYALGPTDIIAEMAKLQQYSFVCAPSFAQYALLRLEEVDLAPVIADYRAKRDLVYEGLKDRFPTVRPGGAFYIFPQVPASFPSATAFVEEAVRHKVLVIPGGVFSGQDTHFRLSFAADTATLRRGLDILNTLAGASP